MASELTWWTPQFQVIDGLRIRYVTSGDGKGRPVLLTSPWPESIYAYHLIWPTLSRAAPLVAIDLPGFGQSQSRADVLNPRAMGDFIVKAVKAFSLDRPHVVAPDVGTTATLYAAVDSKDIFTSMVVGGGAIDERLATGPLKDIIEAPDTNAFEGVDGAELVTTSIAGLMQTKPTEEEMRDYRESYAGHRLVESMAYVRAYPQTLPRLRELLSTIDTPVQIIYGRNDPIVPPAHAELMHGSLPHSRLVALDCGHIAWEDKAREYGASVKVWIEGEFRTV